MWLFLLNAINLTAQPDTLSQLSLDSLFTLLEEELIHINNTHQYDQTYQKAYYVLERSKQEGNPEKIAKAHNIIADWHYYSVPSNDPDDAKPPIFKASNGASPGFFALAGTARAIRGSRLGPGMEP